MFNSLTGVVDEVTTTTLFLSNPYIQWSIKIAAISSSFFTVGEETKVFTYLHHCENGITLYGFHNLAQRELFLQLLKVNGIGPSAALKILSATPQEKIIAAIEHGDGNELAAIPGVGQKTAAKIILALKGQLNLLEDKVPVVASQFEDEFINSLCEMGFQKNVVKKVVVSILANYPSESDFHSIEQQLFKEAIVALSNIG